MSVKEGLPATDFSKMNRDYIRNVAEDETVKDGLPATDFSRMNREYIKAIVEEYGGSDITVEALTATENDTYTAPEGKAYSPVTVNVPAPASDFSTATITIVDPDELMETFYGPVIVDGRADHTFQGDPSDGITVILYDGKAVVEYSADGVATVSGNVTEEDHKYLVTGNATFTFLTH